MLKTIEDFYSGAEQYAAQFNEFVKRNALENLAKADHICYKCGSTESFEYIRALFEFESEFLYQAIVGNRRITYIKLKKPIETILGPINFLELSDQKPDNSQTDRFDHIEVYPVALPYPDFINLLSTKEKVVEDVRPHHTTHDIDIKNGFLFRCTTEPLLQKIKSTEMS